LLRAAHASKLAHMRLVTRVLHVQSGNVKLPDVSVTGKNDTFHLGGLSFSSFRLMACAVRRDLYSGKHQVVDSILPAITRKFIVSVCLAWMSVRLR